MKFLVPTFLMSMLFLGLGQKSDNFSILMILKQSAMEVISKHQDLFNKNIDGSYAKKGITKDRIAKNTYSTFMAESKGKDWDIKKLKGSYDREQLASALAVFLSSARNIIAKNQKKINTDTDGSINPKNFYPAVFGRLTADEFLKRTGIKLKQTTTGKGFGPRNTKYNAPDNWETEALGKLVKASKTNKYGFGEEITSGNKNIYRYIYPLVIKKACLSCHGTPKGGKDISGHIKEGYKLGEIRGGISVSLP